MQCQFKIGDLVILNPASGASHDLPGMLLRIQPIKYHFPNADETFIAWHTVYWADSTCTRHADWQLRKL